MAKSFYGIDLGTTYSCIATIDSDEIVTVIPHALTGELTVPSAVSFDDDGSILVGRAAKNQLGNKPEDTVVFIKREMSNKDYVRRIQGKDYTPVEISSFILKELVDKANQKRADEEGLDPIYDVVITVPAYFGTMERTRTEAAGKMAGLNVLQLINEPTAAALSYGKKNQANKTIMVYDLGGGTFDVSIMKIQNGIMDTLASHGDHQLGGADWDRIIVDYALKEIGTSYDKLTPREQGMMMLAAEETKKTLTSQDKANLSFSYKGIQNVEITREDFEALTADLIERTMMLVDETMEMAGVTPQQIDEVLLVGGSTFMPMVKAAVTEKMGKNPKMADPNLAVAKGAALTALQSEQGYIGTGITLGKDKGSRAYGMDCFIPEYNRVMILNIIMRNDDLEIHRVEEGITTRENNQTGVAFRFYENESTEKYLDIDDSLELEGKGGKIEWGRPVPAGTPIDIVVDRDKSGRVRVFAECMGAKGEFELVTPGAEGLSLNK